MADEWEQYAAKPQATAPSVDEWDKYAASEAPEPTPRPEIVAAKQALQQSVESNMIQKAVAEVSAGLDMALSIPSGVVSLFTAAGHALGGAAASITTPGITPKEILRNARQAGQAASEPLTQPVKKAVKSLEGLTGVKLSADTSVIENIGQKVGEYVEKGAEAGETGAVPSEAYLLLADTAMTALGIKGAQVTSKAVAGHLTKDKVTAELAARGKAEKDALAIEAILGKGEAPPKDVPVAPTPAVAPKAKSAVEVKRELDADRNAQQKAYRLLQEGASMDVVLAARKKDPRVGQHLDEMERIRTGMAEVLVAREVAELARPKTKEALAAELTKRKAERANREILDRIDATRPLVGDTSSLGWMLPPVNRKATSARDIFEQLDERKAVEVDTAFTELTRRKAETNAQADALQVAASRAASEGPTVMEQAFAAAIRPKWERETPRAGILDGIDPVKVNSGDVHNLIGDAINKVEMKRVADIDRAYSHGSLDAAVSKVVRGADFKQGGKVDQKMLTLMGAVGVGGAVGAAIFSDEKLRGAFWGAMTGATLPYLRDLTKVLSVPVGNGLGVLSTAIENISPRMRRLAREHERAVMQTTARRFNKAKGFIKEMKKLKDADEAAITAAVLSGNAAEAAKIVKAIGNPALAKGYVAARELFDEMGKEAKTLGLIDEMLPDYFHRSVKDQEGLLKSLGLEHKTGVEKALSKAELAAGDRKLTAVERSEVINKYMRDMSGPKTGKPGAYKNRVFDEITPEMVKHYDNLPDSLLKYINFHTNAAERAKFFGKHNKYTVAEGRKELDLRGSIGAFIDEEMLKGNIKPGDDVKLKELLHHRFAAKDEMNPILAYGKDVAYAGILANYVAATTQLGDIATVMAAQGVAPTVKAVAQTLTGKSRIDFDATGLAHHIAEELSTTRGTAKFLDKMFTISGFKAVDQLGKTVALQATLNKLEKASKSNAGILELHQKYGNSLDQAEFAQLVRDLQAKNKTDLVDSVLFSELSDIQPISKLEVPPAYLNHPNARILYMLKTFAVKQIDLARRTGYNKMKEGWVKKDPHLVAEGAKNLTRLGLALGISGASLGMVKDFIMGRPADPEMADVIMNITKTFGWSEYTKDVLAKDGPMTAAGTVVLPPYRMFEQIVWKGDPDSVRYLPLIGNVVQSRFMGGAEALEKKATLKEAREANKSLGFDDKELRLSDF